MPLVIILGSLLACILRRMQLCVNCNRGLLLRLLPPLRMLLLLLLFATLCRFACWLACSVTLYLVHQGVDVSVLSHQGRPSSQSRTIENPADRW
jgi:hypothetical protein